MMQPQRPPCHHQTSGNRRRPFLPFAAAALALAMVPWIAAPALAEEGFDRGSKDIFLISAGTFLINFDTNARLDSETLGKGTDLDFENDLGLSSSQNRARLDGYWRFAHKHRLDFAFYYYNRTADRVIDQPIEWGNVIYDVGAELHSEVKFQFFKVNYKYSFVRTQNLEFGFSAGLSTIQTDAEIAGQGTVDGGDVVSYEKKSNSLLVPIPVLGLYGEWRMVRNLYLRGGAEYLAVNVAGWNGSVADLRASVDWYPFKHFGFGVGYNIFRIDALKDATSDFDFRYQFSGLLGYATYVF
jgi:hypothetical protein